MKETPILFSAPMVKAILEGRKTQTRRAVKPQPPAECGIHYMLGNESWMEEQDRAPLRHTWEAWHGPLFESCPEKHLCGHFSVVSPYGQPGDRLWLREEHYRIGHWEPVPNMKTKGGRMKWRFVADSDEVRYSNDPPALFRKGRHHKDPGASVWHKRLARFMPKKLSRITLEIVGVRVERLQEISEEDALAEGGPMEEFHSLNSSLRGWWYPKLWESINGPGSWGANSWVWVLEFKRLEVGA